jgi:hypothetical protein
LCRLSSIYEFSEIIKKIKETESTVSFSLIV